jgi:hypothetical protein
MSKNGNIFKFKDFIIELAIVEISSLNLHEKIIPERLSNLIYNFKMSEVINHPIIVDKNSLVVLDGNHRVEVFKSLGYKYVPVCLVEYGSPHIKVGCWYRIVENKSNSRPISSVLTNFYEVKNEPRNICRLINSMNAFVIVIKNKTMISRHYKNLVETYSNMNSLENNLVSLGFKISYVKEDEAEQKLEKGAAAFIAMPPLSKEMIIEAALSGNLFPQKSSRHVLPVRPIGICFPLRYLKNGTLNEANREFNTWIARKNVKHLPPGQYLEGTRCEEALLLFS